MTGSSYKSFTSLYTEGNLAPYVRSMKSPGGILHMLEAVQPAGDVSRTALPELTLYQDMLGGSRLSGNLGAGSLSVASEKGGVYVAAPNFSNTVLVDKEHRIRSLSFPVEQWRGVLEEASDAHSWLECSQLHMGQLRTPSIQLALRKLWALCDEEGAPSRLLARAAGCEILAELCRLGGAPLAHSRGGLAPWAERRCIELMRTRLSEDISLDELAAEARLSPFHFARMFKQSMGVPPRIYLTRLRVERACELLEMTDLPVTEIAFEVGYSTNQVLARVFLKYRHMSPTDYRRAVRDPVRSIQLR